MPRGSSSEYALLTDQNALRDRLVSSMVVKRHQSARNTKIPWKCKEIGKLYFSERF